jgi:ABC-2 type transport system ATP-binding protein
MKDNIPLQVKGIVKRFKDQSVLSEISIELKQGEILGLLGLNGIGKTTLIKIIIDLLKADSGEVLLFGKSISDISAKQRICYLPEKFNPSSYLRGEEFLELSLNYYGINYDARLAEEYALKLDLDPSCLKKRISSYSKGMGQKLGLVSVFLSQADLLILDEPMSGLDPRARIALKNELKAYKLKGKSIFFSSHILADIEEICDRLAVINKGKIIFQDDTSSFMQHFPASNLEQSFLKSLEMAA